MSSTLPAGVVTFLFTDVEGSTKLLHELGDGYADALHEHRRLLREAFTAHEGVEVDTQGDAFFVAFGRPSDGVAAAADAQLALAGGPIRVRMGLHTGEPRVTDEGYVGLDVPLIPTTGRIKWDDVYSVIVYVIDSKGNVTRVQDDELLR